MNSQLEHVMCIICGEDNAELCIPSTGPTQIVRCRNDGLLYLDPRPSLDHIREFHTQYVRYDNLEMFNCYREAVLRREASALKIMKAGGNLLDVGCATGTFFKEFIGCDWHLYGVETSPVGANLSNANYGADVFCGLLADAHYPPAFFDAVTVLDALFYFPDARATLVEIGRILKRDGLLGVEIPGLRYRFLREKGFDLLAYGWQVGARFFRVDAFILLFACDAKTTARVCGISRGESSA